MTAVLSIENLSKSFTLHTQGHQEIPVFEGVNFSLNKGECIGLVGNSGAGKSTFMRMIYANYVSTGGKVSVLHEGNWIDLVSATPHEVISVRRKTLGYVSQFLRVIPRVSTLDIVSEPAIAIGMDREEAVERAKTLLSRLNIPESLWTLSPLTFSGGEQQRVNIARGFIVRYPVMLLDEPTASLDATNRQTVLDLIKEANADGTAVIGIFHDQAARDAVCTNIFDITKYRIKSDA